MVRKKILIILCIITMLTSVSSEVIAKITKTEVGTQQNFGITLTHSSNTLDKKQQIKFGYRIDTKNAYRIFADSNDFGTTILCLDKDGKFPKESGNGGKYTSLGPASETTLKSAKSSIDATDAKQIQWLIRNAILPEDSEDLKNQKLAQIFNDLMQSTSATENPLTIDEIKSVLTDDDLVFALQYTVWGVTNNLQPGRQIQGTNSDTGTEWDSLSGNDVWGYKGRKGTFINTIINYYTAKLKGNIDEDSSDKTNPTFNNKAITVNIDGGYTYVGPFNINKATNYYSIQLTFKNKGGAILSGVPYYLTDTNTSKSAKILPQTKEALEGKDFYVRLKTNTSARKINIKLTTQATTSSAVGTVWTDGNANDQGLLSIERDEQPGTNVETEKEFDITIEYQYDASLRKYIWGKKTSGSLLGGEKIEELTGLGQPSRVPLKSTLKSEEGAFNQYDYTHKKDPVEFAVGEKVIYTIIVTNECNQNMLIKSITDYLPPKGIEYAKDDNLNTSNGWVYEEATRSASTNIKQNEILKPGASTEVKIVCTVTKDAVGKIITNVAEITQIANESGETVKDIDSTPGNMTKPTTEKDWQEYKGNSSANHGNKDDLNDSTYYYKGQEDDDDFEKIKVPGKIDLALRKSITKVNNQTHDRKRNPGTEPLRDSSEGTTTSNFTDVKTPVEVRVGDIVTYSIRVYNEGTEDAYVGKVEDYIPEGLGYLPQHNKNIEEGWQVDGNFNTIKLSDIANATKNITQESFPSDVADYRNAQVVTGKATLKTTILKDELIPAYNPNTDTLSGKEIEVVCVVLNSATPNTIIKNISAITEYRDKEHRPVTPDIDSDTTNPINPGTYPSDTHIQDDDDFEKLILKIDNGEYNVKIVKEDQDNPVLKLDGAVFNITLPSAGQAQRVTTSNGGIYTSNNITVSQTGTDTITISEITAPNGYYKLIGDIQIEVTKAVQDGVYKATGARLKTSVTGASVELSGNTVIITVQDKKLDGQYNVKIIKEDKNNAGTRLDGAVFNLTLPGKEQAQSVTTANGGIYTSENIQILQPGTDTITINEITAPSGYNKIIGEIQVEVTKELQGNVYKATGARLKTSVTGASVELVDSTVTITIKDEKITGQYNVKLIKEDKDNPELKLDGATFDITLPGNSVAKRVTTSNGGTYTSEDIKISQPGVDTITISEITAPNGYKKIIENLQIEVTKELKSEGYEATGARLKTSVTGASVELDGTTVTITVQDEKIEGQYNLKLTKIDKDNPEITLSDVEFDITLPNETTERKTTNENGIIETENIDITDTSKDDVIKIKEVSTKSGYILLDDEIQINVRKKLEDGKFTVENATLVEESENNEIKLNGNTVELTIKNKKQNIYDLALKKFITKVTSKAGTQKTIPEDQKRFIEVTDVTPLMDRETNPKADAKYNLNKTPVEVAKDDTVTYTIRVFNEGLTDGIVKEIVDTVPDGLEFIKYEKNEDGSFKSGSKINYDYAWETFIDENNENGWKEGIRTRYLENTTIKAFDKEQTTDASQNIEKGLSYVDVQIEFKVVTDEHIQLINIAEITEDDGDDNDSTPDNKIEEEDDEDYDVVIPQKFDLALRKFITQIENQEVTDRVPEVSYEDNKLKYNHTKEPRLVVEGQTVIYTIRIFNEGTIDGYAAEIKDDMPQGITFLPEHETNKKYGWKMYDSEGNETTDVSKAVTIRTKYLSKEESEARNEDNLIKAFDKEAGISDKNPDYRDIQAAFKVTVDSVTNGKRIIINTAEISEDQDEDGNPVEDIDSTPDNDKEDEDDIDKEYLEMKYFDLSLLKYVSKVIVTEDGKTKETKTGYDGTENPEPVVKVELNKKKLKKTTVKYVYSIKITNEGEIEGYATEITDRIPDGLEFYEKDNEEFRWKINEDKTVSTDYLKDTLLKPGESAIVQIVLRWKKSEANLGQKINVAEITEDKNEYGVPDIDSTPNNKVEGEDDQDLAIVVLSLSTGSNPIYLIFSIATLTLIGTGITCLIIYNTKFRKKVV